MRKNFLILLSVATILIFGFVFSLYDVYKKINPSQEYINTCYYKHKNVYSITEEFTPGNDGCYQNLFTSILPKLLIYGAEYKNNDLSLFNVDNLYTIPEQLVRDANMVLTWGVGYDAEFEKWIAQKYPQKRIYSFDCGLKKTEINQFNRIYLNLKFKSECIGTDEYLILGYKSSGKIHSFEQKIRELNLQDKKVYLKLGIPEVHKYMDDILKYKDNILGFSIVVDFWSPRYIIDSSLMFDKINKDFVLIARNPYGIHSVDIEYALDNWASIVSLVYVNKNIVKKSEILFDQNNKTIALKKYSNDFTFAQNSIDFRIVLIEKIKNLFKKS